MENEDNTGRAYGKEAQTYDVSVTMSTVYLNVFRIGFARTTGQSQ